VQRLDQINAFKPANLFDFKSLTLKLRSEQIGRFKTATRRMLSSEPGVAHNFPAPGSWLKRGNSVARNEIDNLDGTG